MTVFACRQGEFCAALQAGRDTSRLTRQRVTVAQLFALETAALGKS